jgi:hypothetical protein
MPKYRITEYVSVRIISEVVEAELPTLAYAKYMQTVDLPQLLRNITGTKMVASVEYADYRESAAVDLLDENGDFKETVMEISDEEINNPEDLP